MESHTYFNPRTREGCDVVGRNVIKSRFISIHAPVKGATERKLQSKRLQRISIHAPVKGATPVSFEKPRNPRISIHAPVKGATSNKKLKEKLEAISIHAPVKGATFNAKSRNRKQTNFNPRTREGCDRLSLL